MTQNEAGKDYSSPTAKTKATFQSSGKAWYAAMLLWFMEDGKNQCHWHGSLSPLKRKSLIYNFITGEVSWEYR